MVAMRVVPMHSANLQMHTDLSRPVMSLLHLPCQAVCLFEGHTCPELATAFGLWLALELGCELVIDISHRCMNRVHTDLCPLSLDGCKGEESAGLHAQGARQVFEDRGAEAGEQEGVDMLLLCLNIRSQVVSHHC